MTGADWWYGAAGGSSGSLGLGATGMAREADVGDSEGVTEEADDAAAAAAAMVALRRSSVPEVPAVAVDAAATVAAPPRPRTFLSPSWSAARRPRWPPWTRPGFLEASGGGSEEEGGAGKRRSPSRSSSPAEGEEAGSEWYGEEKRPRKRSTGGERRGRPGESIGEGSSLVRRGPAGSGSGGRVKTAAEPTYCEMETKQNYPHPQLKITRKCHWGVTLRSLPLSRPPPPVLPGTSPPHALVPANPRETPPEPARRTGNSESGRVKAA
jgi:hypothetical protein